MSRYSRQELLKKLQEELEKRKSNDQLAFFVPNGAQEETIKRLGTVSSLVYTLSAANGIGKTTLVVNILGNIIFGPQNKYFDYPLFQNWPYPKRLRYITDPKLAEDIGPFRTEIERWWPKGKWTSEKVKKSFFSQYSARGFILDVMTYEQETKEFEGVNLGGIFTDEPPPERIWPACVGRLRNGGFIMVPMTPLTDAGWYYEKVVPLHPETTIYADIEQNCKEHGIRGQLDHDKIEQMIAAWPHEEVEARAKGRAMYLRGLIFKTFDPNIHVLKENLKAPYSASMYQVVDPHSDKPFACIWAFPDANGDIYIVDEWPNEDFYRMHNCQLTIQDYQRIFKDKESGWSVRKRIIDRHFADVRTVVNRRTLREELAEDVGLHYEPSYKAEEEIETGIIKVRSYLQYDTDKPLSALNHPKLYINPQCKNTIKSLSNWARDPDNGKIQETYKDFCDVVRYLLMEDPKVDQALPPHHAKKTYG